MPITDFNNDPAFQLASLTSAINLSPIQWGRIQQMNLFREQGIATRTVIVEENAGVLAILPQREVGAPGTVGQKGSRTVRSFIVPHIPHDDYLLPGDVEGMRAFGTESELETIADAMNRKLLAMSQKHDITREHMLSGALRGLVLDADGSTVINMFTEMNVTEQTVDFDFAGTPDVRDSCVEVSRNMQDALLGDTMTGIHALCSEGFWDALIANTQVRDAYDRWRDGEWKRDDGRKGFPYGGINFEEYRATASGGGSTQTFIPVNTARFFPTGTLTTFQLNYAPGDFNETVNTRGLKMYAKQQEMEFGRGWKLHTQSNPLPLCTRPEVLIEGTIT